MTRFWQESQGHDKDLPALQRWSSRSFWRDLGMSHSGMGNSPPIWLDWTRILDLGLSVEKADDDISILSWWGWMSAWQVDNSVCGGLNRPLSSISSHATVGNPDQDPMHNTSTRGGGVGIHRLFRCQPLDLDWTRKKSQSSGSRGQVTCNVYLVW